MQKRQTYGIVFLAMAFLLFLPGVQATLLDFLSKSFNPQTNAVGRAYVDFARCRRYEKMAVSLEQEMSQLCSTPARQQVYVCARDRQLLEKYLGYLDNFCRDDSCDEGQQRCRLSLSGRTQWLEKCLSGIWVSQQVCMAGCREEKCLPEDFSLRLTANPANLSRGLESEILAVVTGKSGRPIPNILVRFGSDSGTFPGPEYLTDESGQVLVPWRAWTPGYARMTAAATVGDTFVEDSIYVLVRT